MGVLVVWMSRMLMAPGVTSRELGLITFILTAASMVASVLATKIYAEEASSKTLRDHGVQIASGIMVLKRQIETLSEWVDDKSNELSDHAPDGLRTQAVLEHVEQTLLGFRAMTDAALGGIGGVIGDALAQYEAVMDQISSTRAEAVVKTTEIERKMETAGSSAELARLEAQVVEIASSTEKRIAQLARSSTLPIPAISPRRTVTPLCPYCGKDNAFEMLDRPGETRVRTCQHCGNRFNVHIASDNRVLTRAAGVAGNAMAPAPGAPQPKVPLGQWALQVLSDVWIEPSELSRLIALVVSIDKAMKLRGVEKTPHRLQEETLRSTEESGISKAKVRRFFFGAYRSRAFEFRVGEIGFKGLYLNDLTEQSLSVTTARSYVWVLSGQGPIAASDAVELAQSLFGPTFPHAEELLRKEIAGLPLDRGLLHVTTENSPPGAQPAGQEGVSQSPATAG
jgi:DNA-directed RNA polymerase subunit M/transcription elongation factor TFIIS